MCDSRFYVFFISLEPCKHIIWHFICLESILSRIPKYRSNAIISRNNYETMAVTKYVEVGE